MLSTLFKPTPIIDDMSKKWLFDTFIWCIEQLDGDFFKQNSKLVLPNNTFYPGKSTSVDEMANAIFSHTINYAGMTSWPIKLVNIESFHQKPMVQLHFGENLRGDNCAISFKTSDEGDANDKSLIEIPFHSSQLNQPQDLIAYLVQTLASILITQNGAIAPGGKDTLAQTTDVVACFLGFGVIFANTAYQFKGGCGSCNNRNLNRKSALPELETVYALAMFCVIKGVDIKQIKKELKSHLFKSFSKAYKEITLYLEKQESPEHSLMLASVKE